MNYTKEKLPKAFVKGEEKMPIKVIESMDLESASLLFDGTCVLSGQNIKSHINQCTFPEYLAGAYPKHRGYLLNNEKGDHAGKTFTVYIFTGPEGKLTLKYIMTPDDGKNKEIEEWAVDANRQLNSHAEFVSATPGFVGDDFVKNYRSIELKYRFK